MASAPFHFGLAARSAPLCFSGDLKPVPIPASFRSKSIGSCNVFFRPFRPFRVKNVTGERQIRGPFSDEDIPDCHSTLCSPVYDASTIASNILYHAKLTSSFSAEYLQLSKAYFATAGSVFDELIRNWNETNSHYEKLNMKQAYYLSMEFLQGRTLLNAIGNLELTGKYAEALKKLGHKLENVASQEQDAALGNGGLGRLASCFLDSLATLNFPAWGYGLRYKYGLFQQTITKDGQEEVAESWLEMGNPWEIVRHDVSYPVKFYGKVVLGSDGRKHWIGGENIMAIAYDIPIPGFQTKTTLNLRLWSTKVSAKAFDLAAFNDGQHEQANKAHANAEKICYVLYPGDESVEGKILRLKQQYTLSSASLQDIIARFERISGNSINWEEFPFKVAVQMNDTHPTLCIPELMRILIDIKGLTWKEAWNITQRTMAYTNHTVLPEALEKWSLELLQKLLPRHVEIIEEIDQELIRNIISEFGSEDLSMLEQRLKDMRILGNIDYPDFVVELFTKAKIAEAKSKKELLEKSLGLATDVASDDLETVDVTEEKGVFKSGQLEKEHQGRKLEKEVEDRQPKKEDDNSQEKEDEGSQLEKVDLHSHLEEEEYNQPEEEDEDFVSTELSWLKSNPKLPMVVQMANLCVVGAHAVNGVAEIHSDIVKRDVFNSFYKLWPEKFQNKTNGVTPRRWLRFCNPELSKILTKWIGTEDWVVNTEKLEELKKFVDNEDLHLEWSAAKTCNKMKAVSFIREKTGYDVSVDAMFDIQVKRIHEYKRQLLNILGIIYRYMKMKEMSAEERTSSFVPRVCIFGGKAFATYVQAKRIVKLITDVGSTINHDPDIGDLLKVVFVQDYNVSTAEILIPASELSQHISTAGMEASGTSNMKFAMNGCILIGTLDGANVEIRQEVGEENFFLFGAQAHEISDLRKQRVEGKFVPDERFEEVKEYVRSGVFGPYDYGELMDSLEGNEGYGRGDFFLVGQDFPGYLECQDMVDKAYRDRKRWTRMSILNTAGSHTFSSDRTIRQYAEDIWNIQPVLLP